MPAYSLDVDWCASENTRLLLLSKSLDERAQAFFGNGSAEVDLLTGEVTTGTGNPVVDTQITAFITFVEGTVE